MQRLVTVLCLVLALTLVMVLPTSASVSPPADDAAPITQPYTVSGNGSIVDLNTSNGNWVVTPSSQWSGTTLLIEVRGGGSSSYQYTTGGSVSGSFSGATYIIVSIYRASDLVLLDYVCDGAC